MFKDIIAQYRKEKETLLAKQYIKRAKLDAIQGFLQADLIKVITGPRRAGKSVFAMLFLKDTDFAYLNFDDEALLTAVNHDEIVQGLHQVYGQTNVILFDEIQNLGGWELFVNKLQRRGYNLVLTGSNAKLLSREMATSLTGRHIPIEILPFSFKEFLAAKNFSAAQDDLGLPETKGRLLYHLEAYLKNGGFPEVAVKALEPKGYLDTLYDAILLKDVVKRHKVRFSQKIYELGVYLINNFSSEFSFTRLKNGLGFNSVNTLQSYLNYLIEAYLVVSLNRFSFKIKEQIKTAKKAYLIDNGFVAAKSIQFSQDTGRLMENLVFAELLKQGFVPDRDLFCYKTRNQKEVDFVLKEGAKIKSLLQVAYQLEYALAKEREVNALIEASEELDCDSLFVITWDKEGEQAHQDKTIKFIPLWKWLLSN